jgi:hypothetical protein
MKGTPQIELFSYVPLLFLEITLEDWVNSGIRCNALQPILEMLQISDHSLRAKAARNLDIKEKINYPQFDKWVEKHIPMKYEREKRGEGEG